jgi:hypothetical protein
MTTDTAPLRLTCRPYASGEAITLPFRVLVLSAEGPPSAVAVESRRPVRVAPETNHDPRLAALLSGVGDDAGAMAGARVQVDVLHLPKDDLADDFEDSPEINRSGLFRVLGSEGWFVHAFEPYALVVPAWTAGTSKADAALLAKCAAVAAEAHAVFLVDLDPACPEDVLPASTRAQPEARHLGLFASGGALAYAARAARAFGLAGWMPEALAPPPEPIGDDASQASPPVRLSAMLLLLRLAHHARAVARFEAYPKTLDRAVVPPALATWLEAQRLPFPAAVTLAAPHALEITVGASSPSGGRLGAPRLSVPLRLPWE